MVSENRILFSWLFPFRYIYGITLCFLVILGGCAPTKYITNEQQALHEADSLFENGNYEYAKLKYISIRDKVPQSDAARDAQYNLGFINVFYNNPFANWETALREFKTFASRYPDDARIGEVNSWIRILVVLQSFDREYHHKKKQLKALEQSKQLTEDEQKHSLESLNETLRTCSKEREDLQKKVDELKQIIIEMERKCQQAGQ